MYGRREIHSLKPGQGLCNGTQLPIRGMHDTCLKVTVLMGYFIGYKVNF